MPGSGTSPDRQERQGVRTDPVRADDVEPTDLARTDLAHTDLAHTDVEPTDLARTDLIPSGALPAWLRPVAEAAGRATVSDFPRALPPDGGGRSSAVLLLFGEGRDGPDILLIERAHTLRSHAGQPAFPGGAVDPDDAGPIAAALRETVEETGLDPAGIDVFGTLPALYLPPSGYLVTPVLGWWRSPSPVRVVDPAEVASVHRVPIASMLGADNRLRVRHPSGFVGPAFDVAGLVVWGFTGGILDRLFALAGWERSWNRSRVEDLPAHLVDLAKPATEPPEPPGRSELPGRGERRHPNDDNEGGTS